MCKFEMKKKKHVRAYGKMPTTQVVLEMPNGRDCGQQLLPCDTVTFFSFAEHLAVISHYSHSAWPHLRQDCTYTIPTCVSVKNKGQLGVRRSQNRCTHKGKYRKHFDSLLTRQSTDPSAGACTREWQYRKTPVQTSCDGTPNPESFLTLFGSPEQATPVQL